MRGFTMRGLVRALGDARGFSAAEAMTILTAMTVLSGVAAPAMSGYLDDAKLVRAQHDVRTISATLIRFFNDVGPERDIDGGWAHATLLVGAGQAPRSGAATAAGWSAELAAEGVWPLDDHLVVNEVGYSVMGGSARRGWRGAYLQDPVRADPWGFRYAVNVGAMRSHFLDTVVLSAGPDGVVHSPFEHDGLPTTRDDIVAIVASSGLGQ
jgi:hypothetical protein